MQMKCKQVLDFFLTRGFVATMRDYPYKKGQRIRINMKYRAEVSNVFDATEKAIKHFTNLSSFSTAEDWIKKAKELHGKMPKYIVLVRRLDR